MPSPTFTAINERPGWSRASNVSDDWDVIEEMAKTLNSTRPARTYFVCGRLQGDSQHFLYRVEIGDPIEIIKAFQVGTHAAESYGEDAHPAVLEQMTQVHARNPIVPFFADPAGLKCTFEKPLSQDFAKFLDSVITEGVEAYADEDEGYIAPVVMREGLLRLWWD